MEALFRPEGEWQRLPPIAVIVHRIEAAILNTIATVVIVGAAWFFFRGTPWVAVAAAVAMVAWTTWRVVRAGRWVRAFAYLEGANDLLISQGLWLASLTAIPYGRMISVEVHTGPLARLWKLAEVELVTASPRSNARIPSLPAADAARLRDQLIALGEEQALPL
ncbi:MAG: PH domain-containing protein [Propionibacteriales bacterium]|nr:PH domain-containing protein [Propionibacteriales bacterium]